MRVLFLAHRAPWPPDKGDQLRSNGILRWLARRHEVHLGAFGDGGDEAAAQRVEDHLRPMCAGLRIVPRPSIVRGARALVTGRPISYEIFDSSTLTDWVRRTVDETKPDAVFGYSGQMAPHLMGIEGVPRVLDLVDVDSAKWKNRYTRSRNPIHALEARRVRAYEERCLRELEALTVTSKREAGLLGGVSERLHVVKTGVDLDFFAERSVDPGGVRIGFVGALDYAPNADGAVWFAREVLPLIRERRPDAEFVVIGRKPPDELTSVPGVTVTGWVDDIRDVMAGFACAVVPIDEANGVQTKALVGMALGLPTVMTTGSAGGVEAVDDEHALVADAPVDFCNAVLRLLDDASLRGRLGRAGRAFVEAECNWENNLPLLERLLRGEERCT